MEARSINRTFLESSLELKCLFFFGVALTVVISVSFYLYFRVTEDQIKAQNPRTANLLVEQEMMLKHLKLQNSPGESADKSMALTPAEHERAGNESYADDFSNIIGHILNCLRQEEFQSNVIRSPNYRNYFVSDTSNASKPKNDFEKELLDRFIKTPIGKSDLPNERDYIDTIGPNGEYHYYRPVRVNVKSCTTCHVKEDNDPVNGDLIAIVHVVIPKP
ncbi:MAG: c-type heme family protein, partial [Thermoguttaceae bacterium]